MEEKLTLANQKRNLQSQLFELESIKRKRLNLDNQEILIKRNIAKKRKFLNKTLKEEGLLVTQGGLFLESVQILDEETEALLRWTAQAID